MSLSVDTNILVYTIDPTHRSKHQAAIEILQQLSLGDHGLTQQVIGEFLNVCRRQDKALHSALRRTAERYARIFPVMQTQAAFLFPAFDRATRFKIQFWDALIITICLANGVTHLLSEDLQDGQKFDGLTIINPFNPGNEATLKRLMAKEETS